MLVAKTFLLPPSPLPQVSNQHDYTLLQKVQSEALGQVQ